MALPNIQVITRKNSLINPINFELPYKTALYLNERHDKAQEAIGKVNAQLGPLLVNANEQDRPAIIERFNSYMTRINEGIDIKSGYAGNALSNALRLAPEAAGDYFILGRIQDNMKYEKWKEQVQARTDIDQKTKDYFIKHTPYYHYDQYEGEGLTEVKENREREARNLEEYNTNPELYISIHGSAPKQHSVLEKVIGGTSWEPNKNPIAQPKMTEIMEKVASLVKPSGMAGDSNLQYDPVTGYFFQDGTKKVGVSKERLKAAFISAINGTPGVREGLAQNLEVGIGSMFDESGIVGSDLSDKKYAITENGTYLDKETGLPIDNEYTDKEGLPLSLDKYIDSIIDPMAKALAYSDITQSRKYIAPPKKSDSSRGKNKNGKNGDEEGTNDADTGSYEGPTVEKLYETANSNKMVMQRASATMRDLANKAGIDPDAYSTPQELKEAMRGSGKISQAFITAYQSFEEAQNKVLGNFGQEETPQADVEEIINSMNTGLGISSSSGNTYAREYNDILNSFYNIGAQTSLPSVYIKTINNNRDYTKDIESNFGESLENYFDIQDGYIEVTQENRYLLPRLLNAYEATNEKLLNSKVNPATLVPGTVVSASIMRGNDIPFEAYAYDTDDNSYTNINTINNKSSAKQAFGNIFANLPSISNPILFAKNAISSTNKLFNSSNPVTELMTFKYNLNNKYNEVNEEYDKTNLYRKNQHDIVIRPWEGLLGEYQLPDMSATDRNTYGNRLIQSIIAYNPRNATEYYVTNHEYNDINTNVTDAAQRIEIQKIIKTIYEAEPNRVKFGYDELTGDPVIQVYGGNHDYSKANNDNPISSDIQKYIPNYNAAFDVIAPFSGDQAFKEAMMSRYDLYGALLLHRAKGSNMEFVPMFNGSSLNINGDDYANVHLNRAQVANLIGSREDWKALQSAIYTNSLNDTQILNSVLEISNKLYSNLKLPTTEELITLQEEANKYDDPSNRAAIMLQGFNDYTNDIRWSIILKTFNDIQ